MTTDSQNPIIIYEDTDKTVEVRLDTAQETVWLTQRQMAELFGKDVRTVNEHVQNVYSERELAREATIRDFRIVRQEGSRQVTRDWTLNHQRFEENARELEAALSLVRSGSSPVHDALASHVKEAFADLS